MLLTTENYKLEKGKQRNYGKHERQKVINQRLFRGIMLKKERYFVNIFT